MFEDGIFPLINQTDLDMGVNSATLVTGSAPRWFLLVDALRETESSLNNTFDMRAIQQTLGSGFSVPFDQPSFSSQQTGINQTGDSKASVVLIALDFARFF